MKHLLLVTGSRALDDFPESRDWAEAVLAGTIGPKDWDVVLSGGCPNSPDSWATDIATRAGVAWVEYRLDGMRYGSDGKTHRWWNAQPDVLGADTAYRRTDRPHPHERNQAMVDLLVKQQAAGWTVSVLGLVAPWSSTKGALVTLGKAAAAKLPVSDQRAPAVTTAKPCACGKGMVRSFSTWECGCGRSEARA